MIEKRLKNSIILSNRHPIFPWYPVFIMDKKKIILQAGFLVLVMAFTLSSLFRKGELAEFLQNIRQARVSWLLAALGLLLAYILLESVIIKIIMHALGENVPMGHCCKYSFAGFFFYCISPAGSAEQPMQLYFMYKDGCKVSSSVFSLAVITLTFKLTLMLLGGYVWLLREQAASVVSGISPLCILGFVLTALATAGFAAIICLPDLVGRAAFFCIRLLHRIRIIKEPDKWQTKASDFTAKYSQALSTCKRHPFMLLIVMVITVIQRLCFMAVTAASCHALGVTGLESWDITMVQGMIGLATEMLPLPGGMGVNEFIYLKALTPVFGDGTLSTLIVSRGVGFYCQLVLCGLVTAAICIFSRVKERKSK